MPDPREIKAFIPKLPDHVNNYHDLSKGNRFPLFRVVEEVGLLPDPQTRGLYYAPQVPVRKVRYFESYEQAHQREAALPAPTTEDYLLYQEYQAQQRIQQSWINDAKQHGEDIIFIEKDVVFDSTTTPSSNK